MFKLMSKSIPFYSKKCVYLDLYVVVLFQDLLLYLLQLVQALKYEDFDKIKEELFDATPARRESISQEEGASPSSLEKERYRNYSI